MGDTRSKKHKPAQDGRMPFAVLPFGVRLSERMIHESCYPQLCMQVTYDEHIDNTRLSHFLHIARRGYMTREYLRSYFDGPDALREFMAGID